MEGEWSNFNAVCVNEEANFMAQLFPNTNNNDVDSTSNAEAASYYGCHHNLYYYSNQDSTYAHLHLMNNNDQHRHQASASNASSSLPIDFLSCDHMDNVEVTLDPPPLPDLPPPPPPPPPQEDKNSDSSENDSRKRPRSSASDHDPRGRRKQMGPKRKRNEEEEEEQEEDENESSCFTQTAALTRSNSNASRKSRASRGSATDPQSLYARKRRERINERLRILQSLVPNGTKVDISTMLEEAVHYVKFLQLQIKLLSSDDLWMYAPIAYNGMNIGLDLKINIPK